MMHFNYMLLAFGLLIFGFQEASSQGFSPTWENIMGDIQCKKKISCKCKLSPRKGPCMAKIPRYYFNTYNKRCRLFTYSGCGGNANNFMTFQECNRACNTFDICQLPKDVGRCKASFPRFYFDTATGNCEPFKYGGCEGNKNNFETLDDCRFACQRSK